MSLDVCVLGSGSSGNSTLVRGAWGAMLIDCGFGPRATAQRLSGTGVTVEDLSAICVTHFDHDHFNDNWLQTIVKRGIKIFCDARRKLLFNKYEQNGGPKLKGLCDLVQGFTCGESFTPLQDVRVRPLRLAHDEAGCHGFLLESQGIKVGYATDLGSVPKALIELFRGVDLLAIESNYDRDMQVNSDRPYHLKQRIMGGAGHLSNEQSFAAVRKIVDESQRACGRVPGHVVLLHRSRQCNAPAAVRAVFEQDARVKRVLTLTEQKERTGWLRVGRGTPVAGVQLALAW